MITLLENSWNLCIEMAPYLLFGFLVAGIIHVIIPMGIIVKHLGKPSFFSVLKAALFGIPIPLCSCGVLPVANKIKDSGASKSATLSFLITTPATGADSILATGALMGWAFTIIRTTATFIIGMMAGVLSNLFAKEKKSSPSRQIPTPNKMTGSFPNILVTKLKGIFKYASIDLPLGFCGSIILGLLLGGAITTLVPPSFISRYLGSPIWGIFLATIIAIPMYVCATGSIPIAAAMITAGFSPGAALAFLIAGPATNTVTMVTVKNMLDKKNLFIYLSVIFLGAVIFGVLVDFFSINIIKIAPPMHHHEEVSLFKRICGVILLINVFSLCFFKIYKKIKNKKSQVS